MKEKTLNKNVEVYEQKFSCLIFGGFFFLGKTFIISQDFLKNNHIFFQVCAVVVASVPSTGYLKNGLI